VIPTPAAPAAPPIATFAHAAKWYGHVIGLVDATVEIGPGVTGLLGPNGAGKSTFLKLLTGQLQPSQGTVRLLGVDPFAAPGVHAQVGFLPEQDSFYEEMTGRAFVRFLAGLHGCHRERADEAVARVGLTDAAHRKIRTYSKGMRQRIKLAQAIVHDPKVLVLDEPLTGMDPVARRQMIDLMRDFERRGATVVVSSHILHEVEAMTDRVILLYQGRVRAMGTREEIRGLLDKHPHQIRVQSPRARELARALLALPGVVGVRLDDGSVHVDTTDPEAVYDRLPRFVLEEGLPVDGLEAEDVSLDAIFGYLVK
jgi:ABC-2 type transport system ATP-binding protein